MKIALIGYGAMGKLIKTSPSEYACGRRFKQKVVRFTTDIPHLTNWGQPLLLGPGSILDANTRSEFVLKKDLTEAALLYAELAKKLIGIESMEHEFDELT